MLLEGWAPDIVVGIDFGMTSTGVAYSTAPEWAEPRTIMHWPGKASWETRSKVDTCVSYSAITQTLQNWGFECDEDDPSVEVNKLFKLFLDPRYVDNSGCAPSQDEIKQWYVDYLASLYLYVQRYCQERIPRFASKNVEWLFSRPTTWKEPSMMAEIERMIKEAGFGKQSEHRISVSLTEAEAAAIYVSKQQMQKGDIFLVSDAGGGTTDINILKVISASRGGTQLEPLQWNGGAAIGSTLIDYKVEKLLLERLARIQGVLDTDPDAIVRDMIRTRFMSYKCAFGSSAMNAPSLILPIPGMPPGQDIEYAGIENSNLILLGLKSGGVQQVCTVKTVLDASDMVLRNDKWYHLRKMYSIAECEVRLLVGTGLHFEVWGRKGCMSRGHEEIAVHWEMPDGDASAVHELDGMHPYDGTPELDSMQKLGEVHELEGLY